MQKSVSLFIFSLNSFSKLWISNWAKLRISDSVFYFYKKLIAMRKDNLIMPYGEVDLIWPDDKEIFAYYKHFKDETWFIAANFSEIEVYRSLPTNLCKAELILTNVPSSDWRSNERLILAPYQAIILRVSDKT